jgi:hypothetical protein
MDPRDDFPAAHSMDTTWFAVDRDGHVACFESGEDGAVPATVQGQIDLETLARLMSAASGGPACFDLMTWIGEGEGSEERHLAWEGDGKPWDWTLLFLESLDPIRGAVSEDQLITAEAPVGVAALVRGLAAADARRLHESGACLGCFGPIPYSRLPDFLGMYRYEHNSGGRSPARSGLRGTASRR